jgi:hypothetical protein
MKCETTYYGVPCNGEAVCIVSGGCRPHPTCEYHKKQWEAQQCYMIVKIEPLPEKTHDF